MKARVKLIDGMTFLGEAGSGHGIVVDASPEIGGHDLGLRPMELVLLGLVGCMAIDVRLILQKGREQVTDCVIEAEAERAATEPKVFTQIAIKIRVVGKNVKREKVERAAQLSAEKYCSVSAMLGKTATITHEIEVVEADA